MTAEASLPGEEASSVPGDGQAGDCSEGVESGASVPVNPDFYVTHGLRDEALHGAFQLRTDWVQGSARAGVDSFCQDEGEPSTEVPCGMGQRGLHW